ncbi:hypothetical protein FA10DRAFT_264734 [Acaromyces ingoldii]|uniref:Uncharacterized protein n=1 Tax=Acaromyces ingoldii TaxID=215250 RepID=A0A316YYQ2_9BASI|nr:hypothetical protein FA10DRAFT_264734 [Acaromyces ingoldii]PWN94166.1 hypothetical protein FA10DRAFT_264734 [Acaromyces ingoldii]
MASPASSSRSAAARVLQRQTGARAFSTSAQTCAEPSSSSTSSPSRGRKPRPQRANVLPPYPEWVSGQGKAYESAPVGRGPFWIGSTPFPLNPTFNPPPPLSQAVRDQMWSLHSQNPSANSVRVLSGRFGVQMERVTAVLRLKALEHEFVKKGKPLQTPFQKQMERLLGSAQDARSIMKEADTAPSSKGANFRGPIREEVPMSAQSEDTPSSIAPALAKEATERKERMRTIPTGGPATKGPAPSKAVVETVDQSRRTRPSLSVTDLSSRPSSYQGAGTATPASQGKRFHFMNAIVFLIILRSCLKQMAGPWRQ